MPEKTVLILGAGASVPYKFPTGNDLREKIISLQENLDQFQYLARRNKSVLRNFLQRFRDSQIETIDSFLSLNPDYTDLAKIAIAIILYKCEDGNAVDNANQSEHWYKYLINKIYPKASEKIFNPDWLEIVTFNYDRSLEYYLQKTFANTFDISGEDAKKNLMKLKIHHVYGKLNCPQYQFGEFDIGNRTAADEEDDGMADFIENSVATLKVINQHRDFDNEGHIKEIKRAIFEAKKIAFLGFGFDPDNIQRLHTAGAFGTFESPKKIYATTMNISATKIQGIKMQLFNAIQGPAVDNSRFEDKSCCQLLVDNMLLE